MLSRQLLQRLHRCEITAALVAAAVLVLSGCGMGHIASDAREASIRNTATAFSEAAGCFGELQVAPGVDLNTLAKQNGLCGDWRTLGATDQELSAWKWDVSNHTWLIQIDESGSGSVVTAMTAGSGMAQVGIQEETHTIVVCWKVALDSSAGKPRISEFECPRQWFANLTAPEVMTITGLRKASSPLGVKPW